MSDRTEEVVPSTCVPEIPEAVELIDSWLHSKRVARNRMLMRSQELKGQAETRAGYVTALAKVFRRHSITEVNDIAAYYMKACKRFDGDYMKAFNPFAHFADFWDYYTDLVI
jgi:hypothetical protein